MNIGSAWLLNTDGNGEGGQSRLDTRLSPLGTMAPTGTLTSRPGVIPGSADGSRYIDGLWVDNNGTGMSTKVNPGRAVVQGSPAAGAYPVYVPETTSITFADGDAGNPRVDLVVLRIYDDQQDASGRTGAVIEIVPGLPAAYPVAPAVPAACLPLAEVFVKAGASTGNGGIDWSTAVIDRRQATVAVGGIIPADRGVSYPGAYPGQYRDNGRGLQRWDGKSWRDMRPTWQEYQPVWGAEEGKVSPQIGNGSISGRYIQDGPQVQFYASLRIGSTTKWGGAGQNGNWFLTLPVPPSLAMPGNFRARTGPDGGGYYFGGCYVYKTTAKDAFTTRVPAGTGVARGWSCSATDGRATGIWVDADYPATPQDGSWYEVWGSYEVDA
ncbi:hypothetical protein [Streptomyces caatingaensis]|uniref:hypothetical protein n=1 Tax=Streptomyces caatingaensis TaxID=1678637 RepID=UPI00069EF060|nr:hypothetical protein [Streptomyces caatingaensis]